MTFIFYPEINCLNIYQFIPFQHIDLNLFCIKIFSAEIKNRFSE